MFVEKSFQGNIATCSYLDALFIIKIKISLFSEFSLAQ